MNECNDPDHGAINAERSESRGLRKAWIEADDKRQQLERELNAVTEQLDRLDSMYHKIIKELLECDPIPACKRKDDQLEPPWEVIARIREQRDRLAEAMDQMWPFIEEDDQPNCNTTEFNKAICAYKQALAAVKGETR